MKNKIGIWIGVLVIGIALLGSLGISLTRQKDQVTIIEELSYGDKSAAEGLTVWARMRYSYHMFWEVTHTIGEPGETVIRNYDQEQREEMPKADRQRRDVVFTFLQVGASTNEYTSEGFVSRVYGLPEMVADVASRTEPGQTRRETLRYCDYMEYYPLYPFFMEFGDVYRKEEETYVKLDETMFDSPAFQKAWQQFLRIPVIPEDQITISVTKDENGQITEETMERSEVTPTLLMLTLETEKGWYFGLSRSAESFDTSCIIGGNGIYFLPIETENGYRCAKPEKLTMVIPLEEDGWLNGLYTDESEESLFVSVYENGSYLVKIYDLSTMEERQVLDLDNMGATGKMSLYPFDDFLLIDSNLYWVFERDASGLYELKSRVPQKILHEHRYVGMPTGASLQEAVIDYNGEHLLIAGWRFRENADPGEGEDGFYISLYDETGLVYYGLYKTSLDTGESRDEAIYSCEPDDYYNFSVEWSEQP